MSEALARNARNTSLAGALVKNVGHSRSFPTCRTSEFQTLDTSGLKTIDINFVEAGLVQAGDVGLMYVWPGHTHIGYAIENNGAANEQLLGAYYHFDTLSRFQLCQLKLFDNPSALPVATGIGWPEVFSAIKKVGDLAALDSGVVATAAEAARYLGENGVMVLPEVGDAEDGDISMLWRKPKGEASITFHADGAVLGYAYVYDAPAAWNLDTLEYRSDELDGLVERLKQL